MKNEKQNKNNLVSFADRKKAAKRITGKNQRGAGQGAGTREPFYKSRYFIFICVAAAVILFVALGLLLTSDRAVGTEEGSTDAEVSVVSDSGRGFPVEFTNNDLIRVEALSSDILALGKKILTCVSAEGSVRFSKIFTYSSPDMSVGDKYGIVYDRSSSKYFVFNSKGVIYEGETENGKHIITARINNNGDIAMVTKSEDSACRVYLTDKKGKVKYIWACAEEYAVSLDMNATGDEILCGAIGSANGIVYTKLYLLDIYSDKEKAAYLIDRSAVVSVRLSGKKLIADCDNARYTFNTRKASDKPETATDYSSKIIACSDDRDGNTAIVTNKVGSMGTNEITVYTKNNEISYRGYTDETVKDIICRGKKVYLLTDKSICISESDGSFRKVSEEEISGEGMVICKGRMYYYSAGHIDINR